MLAVYAHNHIHLEFAALRQALLLAVVVSLGVWLAVLACCGDPAAAATGATLLLLYNGLHVCLLGYLPAGTIWRAGVCRQEPRRLLLALAGVLLAVLVGGAVRRRPRPFRRARPLAEVLVAGNLLFAAGRVAVLEAARLAPAPAPAPAPAARPFDPRRAPTIVNLVLDGYARDDVLRDRYGHDNGPFLAWLEQRGFRVLRRARCNYIQTALSLSSSLNMRYLEPAELPPAGNMDRAPLAALIRRNTLTATLRDRGYEIVAFASGYPLVDALAADVRLGPRRLGEPAATWLDGSWIGSLLGGRLAPRARHLACLEAILDGLPAACACERPRFVFAHLLAPHPPFIFGEDGLLRELPVAHTIDDGSHLVRPGGISPAAYRAAYTAQLRYVTRRVQATLEATLRQAGRPLVILLQADHGPGAGLEWESAAGSDLLERGAIFCAVRFPDGAPAGMRDDQTPVNILRTILNRHAACALPPLPDRTCYSPWSRPYDFRDITARLTIPRGERRQRHGGHGARPAADAPPAKPATAAASRPPAPEIEHAGHL